MIVFQLFECSAPFSGMDPVQAARDAAVLGSRPAFPPRNKLDSVELVSNMTLSMREASHMCSAGFALRIKIPVVLCSDKLFSLRSYVRLSKSAGRVTPRRGRALRTLL